MKHREIQHLLRLLVILAAATAGASAVLALFSLQGPARALALPALLDLAFAPLWLIAAGHLLLARRSVEQEEARARIGAERRRALERSQLFGESFEEVLLEQKERFFTRRLAPVLAFLAFAGAVGMAFATAGIAPVGTGLTPSVQASLLGLRAAAAFVLARYLAGLASPLGLHHLLAAGGAQIHQCLFSLLLAASAACSTRAELEGPVRWLQFAAAAVPAAWALECAVRALLALYGMRPAGLPPHCTLLARVRWNFDLREDLGEAAAYQFGADPRRWLSEGLPRIAAPFLAVFLLALLAGSSFGIIPPGHVGFEERLGRFTGKVLAPGPYLTLPWPLGRVRGLDVESVRNVEVGSLEDPKRPVLWDQEHHLEERALIVPERSGPAPSKLPFDLYVANAVLVYLIAEPVAFHYGHADTAVLVRAEAERQLILQALGSDSRTLLSAERSTFERAVAEGLQRRLEALGTGVRVLRFSVPQIHPPRSTMEAFAASIAARYRKDQTVLEARAFASALDGRLADERRAILAEAEAAASKAVATVQGDRLYFEEARAARQSAGAIFLERKLLDGLAAALGSRRKIIDLSGAQRNVYELNLEETLQPEMLDLVLEGKKK